MHQIKYLHDQNHKIVQLLRSQHNNNNSTDNTHNHKPTIPYIINTRIVANHRINITRLALDKIKSIEMSSVNNNEKKRPCRVTKEVNNAVKDILRNVDFGTTLEELIDQTEKELQTAMDRKV